MFAAVSSDDLVLNYVITIVLIIVVSGAMCIYFERRLSRRSSSTLGKNDVNLLRQMASVLTKIVTIHDNAPFGLQEKLMNEAKACITAYNHTKEDAE